MQQSECLGNEVLPYDESGAFAASGNTLVHRDPRDPNQFTLAYGIKNSTLQELQFHFQILNGAPKSFIYNKDTHGSGSPESQSDNLAADLAWWKVKLEGIVDYYYSASAMLGDRTTPPEYFAPKRVDDVIKSMDVQKNEMLEFLRTRSIVKVNEDLLDKVEAVTVRYLKSVPWQGDMAEFWVRLTRELSPFLAKMQVNDASQLGLANIQFRDRYISELTQLVLFRASLKQSFALVYELLDYQSRLALLDPRNMDRSKETDPLAPAELPVLPAPEPGDD